jgi:type II secretory pathway component PulM
MFSSFQQFWQERDPREQVLLAVMGVLVALVIFWQFILNPVFSAQSDARADLLRAERDYTTVARTLPTLSSGGRAAVTRPFSQAVFIETARARGINPSRVQPDGRESLTVWIETQDTQALYGLLNDVIVKNGAVLSRASIATSVNQNLTAQLTFAL